MEKRRDEKLSLNMLNVDVNVCVCACVRAYVYVQTLKKLSEFLTEKGTYEEFEWAQDCAVKAQNFEIVYGNYRRENKMIA